MDKQNICKAFEQLHEAYHNDITVAPPKWYEELFNANKLSQFFLESNFFLLSAPGYKFENLDLEVSQVGKLKNLVIARFNDDPEYVSIINLIFKTSEIITTYVASIIPESRWVVFDNDIFDNDITIPQDPIQVLPSNVEEFTLTLRELLLWCSFTQINNAILSDIPDWVGLSLCEVIWIEDQYSDFADELITPRSLKLSELHSYFDKHLDSEIHIFSVTTSNETLVSFSLIGETFYTATNIEYDPEWRKM